MHLVRMASALNNSGLPMIDCIHCLYPHTCVYVKINIAVVIMPLIAADGTVIPCRAQTETSRNYLHCCDVCLCK